ncbi:unnamed protein product [Periconia digitata]|uniref:Uncharacterized protein n=1 Tax=Periconia digitata TaxID=1303443 RepID=A0A9W4UF06_9PLEO|nr:unnamed protein product [Periconia digitata]
MPVAAPRSRGQQPAALRPSDRFSSAAILASAFNFIRGSILYLLLKSLPHHAVCLVFETAPAKRPGNYSAYQTFPGYCSLSSIRPSSLYLLKRFIVASKRRSIMWFVA